MKYVKHRISYQQGLKWWFLFSFINSYATGGDISNITLEFSSYFISSRRLIFHVYRLPPFWHHWGTILASPRYNFESNLQMKQYVASTQGQGSTLDWKYITTILLARGHNIGTLKMLPGPRIAKWNFITEWGKSKLPTFVKKPLSPKHSCVHFH